MGKMRTGRILKDSERYSRTVWILLAVWGWLYLPFLGSSELEREEGHRATPTQEMWDRGDWVLPTYLNEPYLKKPPGFYWAVWAISLPFGEVTVWSLRLTSAIGTLAGVCWFTVKWNFAGSKIVSRPI